MTTSRIEPTQRRHLGVWDLCDWSLTIASRFGSAFEETTRLATIGVPVAVPGQRSLPGTVYGDLTSSNELPTEATHSMRYP